MKNKNLLIIAVVAVVVLFIGGYFLFANKAQAPQDITDEASLDEEVISLNPEDIGLEMVASSNKRQVKFIINKPEGIETIEYELSYEADATGSEEEGRVPRGVAGEDEIDPTDEKYESKFLDLGSCSSGTCKYDTGVESVNLLLKIIKTDGKVYQVQDSLEL